MSILSTWLRSEADKLTAEKINKFEEQAFAWNENSKIFAQSFEINGFKFIKLMIIGPLRVETFDGCKVIFTTTNGSIEVQSDSTEINTDFSVSLGIGMTEFDTDLDDELFNAISTDNVRAITISFKNSSVKFLILDGSILKSITAEVIAQEDDKSQTE